jgi:hypothetical protein
MQFKVPQFIDIEDKVIGPLTIKQFVYLAGGAGLAYLAGHFLPTLLALVFVPVFIGLALALAFFRYNDKPFIHLLESLAKFYSRSRLYLWHTNTTKKAVAAPTAAVAERATLTESKLKTLSWSLDVIDPNTNS